MPYSVTSATRSVTPVVTIGGITLPDVISASIRFSLDSPVPTADVLVADKMPTWIERNLSVTIDCAGRLFTGIVKRRQHAVGQSTIQCVGKTQKMWQPFKVTGWVFTNISAKAAVEQILDDIGLTDRSITMVAWQIGVVQDAVLDITTPGDAIQKIIDVDGHRMFETPSGALVIRELLAVPASSAFRTYTTVGTAPWVNDISDDEDPDQVKKEVIVSGANIGSTDSEGNAGSEQVVSPPVFTDSTDLLPGPHELYSMNYQSDLIEDVPKATSVGMRLLDKFHRVIERISMTVPLDPDIMLAMTIGVQDTKVTGRAVLWFVEGYTHSFGGGQCDTQLDLVGGDQSGTTGKVAPIADFVYKVEQELIGTEMRTLVSCHSISQDLDGTIVGYAWLDTYSPPNSASGADMTDIAWVYDPTVMTTVDISLTVTDNDGYTTTITKTIYIGPGACEDMFVPTIAAACYAGTGAGMFTPDGGFTWNDKAAPSGHFVSVSAAAYGGPDDNGVILLGTDNGKIYISIDRLATAPTLAYTEPGGSKINHIWWDTNVINSVWAGTQSGKLYRSIGGAVGTWELYYDFGALWGPINRIATPKGPAVVFVFGGRADAPNTLIAWNWQDNANIWHQPDMSGFAPSAAGDTVIEAAANVTPECCIIFEGAREPAIMYTADLYAIPVVWQNAVGLAAGLVHGRYVCPEGASVGEDGGTAGTFIAAFNNKEIWATSDGVNWVRTVTQLATPGKPVLSEVAGALVNGVYGYRVSAINDNGETLASAEETITIADGPKGVRITWAAVTGATGYNIYGRTSGAEQFMHQVAALTQWDDNGSIVPAGALPAVNSTAWVLPGTDSNEPWHAMNVKDHPTLFFGASIEGLWKTTDGGITVHFIRPAAGISTWPGSAVGKMISFVAQASEVNMEPANLYAIFDDRVDSHLKLVKLNGTVWSFQNTNLSASSKKLRKFGSLLFLVNGGYTTCGSLERSADDGVTFVPVLDRCSVVECGPDGAFWAITHSAALTGLGYPEDWYINSSPDGLVWTQVATITMYGGTTRPTPITSLDIHPQNAQWLVAAGRVRLDNSDVTYSLDGAQTWTQILDGGLGSPGANEWTHCVWGQNNRLVLFDALEGAQILDQPWAGPWTWKYGGWCHGGVQLQVLKVVRAGMWLYCAREYNNVGSVIRTPDNADTWEEVSTDAAFDGDHYGGAYSGDGERLYFVANNGWDNKKAVYRLAPATAPLADLIRVSLHYNLSDLFTSLHPDGVRFLDQCLVIG